MKYPGLLLAVLFICFNAVSADAQEGTFDDMGFIPAAVHVPAEFQSMIYNDGHVFVATSDGVWKNNISTGAWSRSGLEGKSISAIYQHPGNPDRFFAGVYSDNSAEFKTLYLSSDGGGSWIAADQPVYDSMIDVYENYVSFAARPGYPEHIYANLEGGAMIAVSTDGGSSWTRMNYESSSYFGYQSCITFLPEDPDHLFQGSENPLDDAWLGRYDIDPEDPALLGNYTKLIGIDTWSNRRPTQLQAHAYTGNSLYIGNEGALSKVTDGVHQFIYKSDGETEKPYSYIYGIWVNPDNPDHILFGGSLNGSEQPMQLYETQDEGATFHRFTDKFGLDNPQVCEIADTDPYPAVLLNDVGADKVKLLVYKPDATGLSGRQLPESYISVAPNPVQDEVTITYSSAFRFKRFSLSLINSMGQILWFRQAAAGISKVDMTGYAPGIYYLHFNAEGRTLSKKIVKR